MHQCASARKCFAHHFNCRQVATHCFECGHLCNVGNVGRGVRLKVDCSLHHIFWPDHPANAPARHCIRFCNAIDDDAFVGDLWHERWHRRKLVLSIREVLVDFVGDDPNAVLNSPLTYRNSFLWRIDSATWVVGRHKEQHFGARSTNFFELLNSDLEICFFCGVNNDRNAIGKRNSLRIRCPIRSRNNYFIARIAQRGECNKHCMLATVCHEHL